MKAIFQNLAWIHRPDDTIPEPKSPIDLAARERDVLQLLLQGNAPKVIAQELEISRHTVGDYVKKIYRAFDVKSRGELLSRFITGDPRKE